MVILWILQHFKYFRCTLHWVKTCYRHCWVAKYALMIISALKLNCIKLMSNGEHWWSIGRFENWFNSVTMQQGSLQAVDSGLLWQEKWAAEVVQRRTWNQCILPHGNRFFIEAESNNQCANKLRFVRHRFGVYSSKNRDPHSKYVHFLGTIWYQQIYRALKKKRLLHSQWW